MTASHSTSLPIERGGWTNSLLPPRSRSLLRYHLGKLQEAVNILTTHPEDARSRLRACWTPFVLAGGCVPEHLQEEYRGIRTDLMKRQYQPPAWEPEGGHKWDMWVGGGWIKADSPYGMMVHTTRTMQRQTASQLADRILALSLLWKDWLDLMPPERAADNTLRTL